MLIHTTLVVCAYAQLVSKFHRYVHASLFSLLTRVRIRRRTEMSHFNGINYMNVINAFLRVIDTGAWFHVIAYNYAICNMTKVAHNTDHFSRTCGEGWALECERQVTTRFTLQTNIPKRTLRTTATKALAEITTKRVQLEGLENGFWPPYFVLEACWQPQTLLHLWAHCVRLI